MKKTLITLIAAVAMVAFVGCKNNQKAEPVQEDVATGATEQVEHKCMHEGDSTSCCQMDSTKACCKNDSTKACCKEKAGGCPKEAAK